MQCAKHVLHVQKSIDGRKKSYFIPILILFPLFIFAGHSPVLASKDFRASIVSMAPYVNQRAAVGEQLVGKSSNGVNKV
jgi:hypothetical protein